MTQEEIKDLKESCKILGLEPSEYLVLEEVQKGVTSEEVDWKSKYNEQISLNRELIKLLANSEKRIAENTSLQFEEVQKGINVLKQKFDEFDNTPMHQPKSMRVLEKSFLGGEEESKANKTLSMSRNQSELKKYLGERMLEEMSKGVREGVFGKASLAFDASHNLPQYLIREIFNIDKTLIVS